MNTINLIFTKPSTNTLWRLKRKNIRPFLLCGHVWIICTIYVSSPGLHHFISDE